ncbi:MAG: hypothetical protein HKL81_03895 [Acidimicrobiaceae bacterium]|nr:hypothetical protein [Acidimicrobiaceae bacterium]
MPPSSISNNSQWEDVLSSAARLQTILPQAVLVGGTAASIYAHHRLSTDDDHVLINLKQNFDEILAQLESVAGWTTARITRPVQILGSLDGIETGIRQLIRQEPLETTTVRVGKHQITVPTEAELLRIKAVLILRRNATRDYLDTAALINHLGRPQTTEALSRFDILYPQANGQSALQQLEVQLVKPLPYDLDATELPRYKNLDPKWHKWETVVSACMECAIWIQSDIIGQHVEHKPPSI